MGLHRRAFLAGLLLAGGCAPAGRSPEVDRALSNYFVGDYGSAKHALAPLADKTDENYVLNNVRLGSVALIDYDLRGAESAFYRAYEVINSTKVNDPGRATAAALLAEQVKVWKGEPFERAMTNFYLGLIYYMQKDYSNARGAFENALFKLRDYGESKGEDGDRYEEVESNFTIAYLMLARCWQKLGEEEKAEGMFARVRELRSDLAPLAESSRHARANVLLVADFGSGPSKVLEGDNSLVAFRPRPEEVGPMPLARVSVNGQNIALRGLGVPPVDLLAMAQDRRWQSIDTIRLTKSVIGTGLMGVGAYQAGAKRDYGAAAALIAAGALLKATATGDVRHWELLPRSVYIIPLRLTPGRHDVMVSFGGGLSQTWQGIVAPEEGDEATYYLRVKKMGAEVRSWPPEGLSGEHAGANVEQSVVAEAGRVTTRTETNSGAAAPGQMGSERISRRERMRGRTAPAGQDGKIEFDYEK